jgi:hypothetical protein
MLRRTIEQSIVEEKLEETLKVIIKRESKEKRRKIIIKEQIRTVILSILEDIKESIFDIDESLCFENYIQINNSIENLPEIKYRLKLELKRNEIIRIATKLNIIKCHY